MKVNNVLAIGLLFVVIPLLWIGHGREWFILPESIIGASIVTWTLIIQFFFRKKP